MPRLLSVLAVVCLLAAGHVRAEDLRPGGAPSERLAAATAAPAVLTTRPSHPRPAWRPWPYEAARAPIVPSPVRVGAPLAPRITAPLAEPAPPVPYSRGPPRG